MEHQVSAGTDLCVSDMEQRQRQKAGSSTLKHHFTSNNTSLLISTEAGKHEAATGVSGLRRKVSIVSYKQACNLSGSQANLQITLGIVSRRGTKTCIMNRAPHDIQYTLSADFECSEVL